MYEFPPEPWRSNTWDTVGIQLLWLLAGFVVIAILSRSKRRPTIADAVVFLFIGIVLTFAFTTEYAAYLGKPIAHPVFVILTWGMVILATLRNWQRLAKAASGTNVLYSLSLNLMLIIFIGCFLIPPPSTPREASRRTQCKNNLKQIGLALHNYHDTYERFPSHQSGQPPHSWRVTVLPFIDQAPLYREYDFAEKWNTGSNEKIAKTELPVYQCPSDPFMTGTDGFPFTAYAALVGTESIWQPQESLRIRDITDGMTNTLLVVEACGQRIPWAQPKDVLLSESELMMNASGKELGRSESAFSSFHTGGIQALIGDGSVHFLSENMDKDVLKALSTASGGDVVGDF